MVHCANCGYNFGPNSPKFCGMCGTTSNSTNLYNDKPGSVKSDEQTIGALNHLLEDKIQRIHNEGPSSSYSAPPPPRQRTSDETKLCTGCNNAITGEHIELHGALWHDNCFRCTSCNKKFQGGGKIQVFEKAGKPFCENCFNTQFMEACAGCGQPLVGSVVKAMNKTWHPQCFKCASCGVSVSKSFVNKDGRPYCTNCDQ